MYRIGVDLGGTNIAVGLVDSEHLCLIKKISTPTKAERSADEIVADIAAQCVKICEECGVSKHDVASIGIASPGNINSAAGVVEYACNLPFRDLPITKMVKDAFGTDVPVKVANDANAAGWGEACAGAARGTRHSMVITLGTGVGSGIVIDGKIFEGSNGAGGELGHTVIDVNGPACSCGRRGCWEVFSSATALVRMTNEKIEECRESGRESALLKAPKINGRTACDLARQGDAAAKEVYDKYVGYLAIGLANTINTFQPEVISLGGGVSGEGQSLIDALVPLIKKESYGGKLTTQIRIAELGNDAGIIGAAML